jgi:EAL domain-containing protein (putative c-di-GMP-specific phosphodiesterase class I)
VSPDELIEAVEPTEVMHLLTIHMVDLVCAQIDAWNRRGLRVRVAVNASVQDLHDTDFPAQILTLLRSHGVPPEQLTIEITERMVLGDTERMSRAARRISAMGIGLSLDDFGTGFASIQQLRVLPLTEVKIDKSYVNGMTSNGAQRAIVTGVHQLATALHLAVVAEGVEDASTAAALNRLPGMIGQGWHFGHPVSADEFAEQWQAGRQPAAAARTDRGRMRAR